MDKNKKKLLWGLFIAVWGIGVVIAFFSGKKSNLENYNVIMRPDERSASPLLEPVPLLFKLDRGTLELYKYSMKMGREVDLTIIDEKGNPLNPSQSDRIAFDFFSLNVLDHDLRDEESLKKSVKFLIEKDQKEEHYRGMVEEDDEDQGSGPVDMEKGAELKDPKPQIYTN